MSTYRDPWWGLRNPWAQVKQLGESVAEFISDHLIWIILVRRDRRFVCPEHYKEEYVAHDEGAYTLDTSSVCEVCWGTGLKVYPLIVPCMLMTNRLIGRLKPVDVPAEPGYIEKAITAVFMPRSAYPQDQDLVLTCEWDKSYEDFLVPPKPRPIRVIDSSYITTTWPFVDNRIQWFGCSIESLNVNKAFLNALVRKVKDLPILKPNMWDSGVKITESDHKYVVFEQVTESTTWNITHNMGIRPRVEVYSTSGNPLQPSSIKHINHNEVTIEFTNPTAGRAVLRS